MANRCEKGKEREGGGSLETKFRTRVTLTNLVGNIRVKVPCIFRVTKFRFEWGWISMYVCPVYPAEPGMRLQNA